MYRFSTEDSGQFPGKIRPLSGQNPGNVRALHWTQAHGQEAVRTLAEITGNLPLILWSPMSQHHASFILFILTL